MISIAMFNYQRVMEISSEQTCGIIMVILEGDGDMIGYVRSLERWLEKATIPK